MSTRIRIDPNIRMGRSGLYTYTGLEDADGPLRTGSEVIAYEEESGLQWPARVAGIVPVKDLVYLEVDWGDGSCPAGPDSHSC